MSVTPKQIIDLIQRFESNLESYQNPAYNETQLRQEFINSFFEALGWDVTNKAGYAEAYKDLIHEDAIKVGSATKAPDYCFRIGGARKFFLEAKKPSVNIKDDSGPAYQLRRYAWSAKLPLSILTDFEEFAVYDCRIRPLPTDKSSVGRILYLTYKEYATRWDEVASVFSKEAIMHGSFDKFATGKGKRGTSEVDAEFLTEIEGWRDALARNLALRNPDLTVRDLNFAVQRTIDRIIFLRMCEDRRIESYGQLMALLNGENTYKRLQYIYGLADDRYNSGLFHFKAEKERAESPDELTLTLAIDDKVLKDIIRRLYYPESPYEFSVLSADILGNVYEQFLGKVIRLTAGHRAVVEEKPEVKKAGGVYYTPAYIVDYIVKNTVGKLCEGKTPKQISKLRVLDPACGSGSFLIGAYTFLLNYHHDWYVKDGTEKHTKEIYQGAGGQWLLTTQEKKRILLNNIYGVDIDSQAVEVTKLSLLLKVLEGENQQTLASQLRMWRERALPDLGSNIKCGNSLIGPDYYEGRQATMFDDEESQRVNVFDWNTEFSEIMKAGGFDAVIGNPPYVRSINLKESDPVLWNLYGSHYKSASQREWDIYLIFVEKGLSLLKANGSLGYILPNKFLNSQVGENLRTILSEGNYLERLVHFGAFQIFKGATTYTCLLFLHGGGRDQAEVSRYTGPVKNSGGLCPLPGKEPTLWVISEVPAKKLTAAPWQFAASGGALLEKFRKWPGLESVARVFKGTGTDADRVFVVEDRGKKEGLVRIYSPEKELEYLLETTFLKPALRGRSIGRYEVVDQKLLLVVPYEVINGKSILVSEKKLSELAPRTLEYLRECKPRLDEREKGRFKGEGWFCYGRPQNLDRFEVPEKIVLPDVASHGTLMLDREGRWLLDTAYAITRKPDAHLDLRFILAILNSPMLTYFLKETGTALRGGYFRMKTAYLNPFPIRPINFSEPADKARHDKMVALVERMLGLHKQLKTTKSPDDKIQLQRQIDATDKQIDQLVYELYGLTEEEIRIVVEATQ